MTIKISYNDKPYEEITKASACVMGLKIISHSNTVSSLNLDDLQFKNTYIRLNRNLPNGATCEFFVYELPEHIYEKYKDLTILSVNFEGVSIEATI